jgi:DNA-directed RNA polymerase specialized sigma24 family protein
MSPERSQNSTPKNGISTRRPLLESDQRKPQVPSRAAQSVPTVLNEASFDASVRIGLLKARDRFRISVTPHTRQLAEEAAAGLLVSFDPSRASLSSCLDQFLPLRIVDALRKETRYDRRPASGRQSPANEEQTTEGAPRRRVLNCTDASIDLEVVGGACSSLAGDADESGLELRRYVVGLSERAMAIVELRLVDGLLFREIGSLLALSESTVSQTFNEAINLLKRDRSVSTGKSAQRHAQRSASLVAFCRLVKELRDGASFSSIAEELHERLKVQGLLERIVESERPELRSFKIWVVRQTDSARRSYDRASFIKGVRRFVVELPLHSPELSDLRTGFTSLLLRPEVAGTAMARANRKEVVSRICQSLDAVPPDRQMYGWFPGVTTRVELQRALVMEGLLTPERPTGSVISFKGSYSAYLKQEVVGPEWARRNLIAALRESYPNLDAVKESKVFADLLGLKKQRGPKQLARALVQGGVLSATPPDGHTCEKRRASYYYDHDVVGADAASRNTATLISRRYRTLDHVTDDPSLAAGIGHSGSRQHRLSRIEIAARLVKSGLISPILPNRLPPGYRRGSLYFDPSVVGSELAGVNLKAFVLRQAKSLDELKPWSVVCLAIGIEVSARALAVYCVENGIMDWRVPTDGKVGEKGRISFYFDPVVMKPDRLQENLRRYIRVVFPSPDLIFKQKALCSVLGVPYRTSALQAAVARLEVYNQR